MYINIIYEEEYNLIDIEELIERLEDITSKKYFLHKSVPTFNKENIEYKNYLTTVKDLVSVKEIFDGITALELKVDSAFPISIDEKNMGRNLDLISVQLIREFNDKVNAEKLKPHILQQTKDLIFQTTKKINTQLNLLDNLNTPKNNMILSYLVEEEIENITNLIENKYERTVFAKDLYKFSIDGYEDIIVHNTAILEYSGFVFIVKDVSGSNELFILNKEKEI